MGEPIEVIARYEGFQEEGLDVHDDAQEIEVVLGGFSVIVRPYGDHGTGRIAIDVQATNPNQAVKMAGPIWPNGPGRTALV